MGAGDFDVLIRVADFLADLLAHAHGAEDGIGADKGNLPQGGQPRRDAAGALFCDAHIHILIRVGFGEGQGLAAFAHVRVHDPDVGVFPAQDHHFIAEGVSQCFSRHF